MASVRTRGLGFKTEAEYQKQLGPKTLTTLVKEQFQSNFTFPNHVYSVISSPN